MRAKKLREIFLLRLLNITKNQGNFNDFYSSGKRDMFFFFRIIKFTAVDGIAGSSTLYDIKQNGIK